MKYVVMFRKIVLDADAELQRDIPEAWRAKALSKVKSIDQENVGVNLRVCVHVILTCFSADYLTWVLLP